MRAGLETTDPGMRYFRMLRSAIRSFSIYRGLPSSIYTLLFANVVNGIGVFVFPFLTLFLTSIMGMS